MRKNAILVLAAAVVVAWSIPAFAVEGLNWGVGLKGWYNDMEVGFSDVKLKSEDPVFMVGPNVKVAYKGFFAGTSYLFTTTDYNFEFAPGIELTASRRDFDLLAGYMFIPNVGAFLGYKNVIQEFETNFGFPSFEDTYNLGAVGVTGNYGLPTIPLAFYANAAYLMGKWEESGGTLTSEIDSDVAGFAIEAGANYRIWQGLSAGLGYKWQRLTIEEDLPTIVEQKNTFKGFTLSVDYNF